MDKGGAGASGDGGGQRNGADLGTGGRAVFQQAVSVRRGVLSGVLGASGSGGGPEKKPAVVCGQLWICRGAGLYGTAGHVPAAGLRRRRRGVFSRIRSVDGRQRPAVRPFAGTADAPSDGVFHRWETGAQDPSPRQNREPGGPPDVSFAGADLPSGLGDTVYRLSAVPAGVLSRPVLLRYDLAVGPVRLRNLFHPPPAGPHGVCRMADRDGKSAVWHLQPGAVFSTLWCSCFSCPDVWPGRWHFWQSGRPIRRLCF